MLAASHSSFSNQWYPDSGASHHVTSDMQNIQNIIPYEGSDQILVGNGQGLPISSSGSYFQSPLNSNVSLVFHNLLHVPNITKNLVRVRKFTKDNRVFFEFHPDVCFLKSQDSRKVLLRGDVEAEGLYKFTDLHLLPK